MAYSLCEESQLNNPKTVQYYPEEYDYPAYYHKVSELRVTYPPIQNVKKSKRAVASINYVNERKCPIYVHQFNKIQSVSTCNNYPSKPIKCAQEKQCTRTKKMPNFSTTKSVLDQLEETYWATWKPNKETVIHLPKRNSHEGRMNKNIAYGDVAETLVNYFARKEFDTSADSVIESDVEKYGRTITNPSEIHAPRRNHGRLSITSTQEIQTDAYPLILPTAKESKSAEITFAAVTVTEDDNTQPEQSAPSAVTSDNTVAEANIFEEEEEETVQETGNSDQDTNKLLRHTDSFIINKKKQNEVKEHFQQPKCIRLYRKPGISFTSFTKGGSYPLKSCLKREPVQKGNFRLGAPGSPLFVTTSSYNKKSRK